MSNHRAIATVTAVLEAILGDVFSEVVSSTVTVTTGRPNDPGVDPPARINLFLYHVSPNAALRNEDLPTRSTRGELVARPQIALDLHYLVSFYGSDAELEAQRLLGGVATRLHAEPLLRPERIRAVLAATAPGDAHEFLLESDLHEQVDLVRFTPLALDVEHLSKLWSLMAQVPYALSIAYKASVVLMSPDTRAREALPVLTPVIGSRPGARPVLERAEVASAPDEPIVIGSIVRVRGEALGDRSLQILFDDVAFTPLSQTASDVSIALALPPAAELRAGARLMRAIVPGTGAESPPLAVALHPTVRFRAGAATADSATIVYAGSTALMRLRVTPAISPGQRVELLLASAPGEPSRSVAIPIDAPLARTTDLDVSITDVPPGAYLVRLRVDGAASALTTEVVDGVRRFARPRLELT